VTPIIALTMGEPAGIGGDIALKSWLRRGEGLAPFFVVDDPRRLEGLADRLKLPVPITAIADAGDAASTFARALPVMPIELPLPVSPGRLDPGNGVAVLRSIELATGLAKSGAVGAVVTNPIHKHVLYQAGFRHPGHTEYLAELSGPDDAGLIPKPVMMLACRGLRVVPVTIHIPLRQAIADLTGDRIVETGRILAEDLKRRFGLADPVIAVAGLNPHAGESGSIGTEDRDIVEPAVRRLQADGVRATGPWSPDSMFHAEARAAYDAALCMYHDQALIPIKTLDFFGGVNVTLGLPFIRTSPDHGTALDIAGTGKANEASLMAALRMAAEMAATASLPATRSRLAVG
jgi:4-hydroxythreonine-4-phosphate dehydrogenase